MRSKKGDGKKPPVHFRISEAARIMGVSASSLRNWERMGLLTPSRSQGRYRMYSREALEKLKKIKYLRTVKHVNPAGIAAILTGTAKESTQASAHELPEGEKQKREAIAQQLTKLRRELGLTLAEVAQRTGVSVSFLSSLERGYANASIATLQELARAYKTSVLSFFAGNENTRRLVRPRERQILKPNPGVQMELLAFGRNAMEPHIFRIAPGAGSGGSYRHEGEEFIYVLQGSLEIWLDEIENYTLETGDSLYFESSRAHRWQSLCEKETVLLWINTPATF
jgi:DNA-binding transcriptional MerR regulator/quercetin dioxygenase-like cupin family protein